MQPGLATLIANILAAGRPAARIVFAASALASAVALPAVARGATAQWTNSTIDSWLYHNVGGGTFGAAPTFTGDLQLDDEAGAFLPSNIARLGQALFGFDTEGQITPGLAPPRYQITSVTMTLFVEPRGVMDLNYRAAPITNAEIIADFFAQEVDTARPFELYGVGFSQGYTQLGFGPFVAGPPLFEETTFNFPASGYIAFPIASKDNRCCGYVDVTNSLTGGVSATEVDGVTEPFDPEPWAIGTLDLAPGEAIEGDAAVTFSLDLSSLAVRQYMQSALATGSLGFIASSWHLTEEFGAGGAYPAWHTQESGRPEVFPRLSIEYEIVEELPGDFDGNRVVDANDLLLWQCTQGAAVLAGLGADGSANGLVDGADLAIWKANFGRQAGGSIAGAGTAVPEPAAAGLALAALLAGACRIRLATARDTELA